MNDNFEILEHAGEHLSQASYEESPYSDSSWEVIDELPEVQEFTPLEVNVLQEEWVSSDPMFADYGGVSTSDESVRWHLPQDLAWQPRSAESQVSLEEEKAAVEAKRQEELDVIRAEAYAQGKVDGAAEAEQAATEQQQQLEGRVQEVFSDLQQQISEAVENTEKEATQLALSISERIIGHAVEINPEYIISVIKEAISLAGTATVKTVKLSSADLEFVQVMGLTKDLQTDSSWEFVADDTVRAGCIIETSAGQIDYDLDKAWSRIADQILRIVK